MTLVRLRSGACVEARRVERDTRMLTAEIPVVQYEIHPAAGGRPVAVPRPAGWARRQWPLRDVVEIVDDLDEDEEASR